ncbi:MAG: type II toxin-antitoxin system Y4mF family antitoxin [Gemmatimonadota bacterium]|nr:type II toxin-antitoxin system Y4mF family antitoxin [Gemmatimonadota bacterium]
MPRRDSASDYPDTTRVARLGEEVRRRRRELGLRQAELAELAGCSQRFVHTIEGGKTSLRLDKVLDVLEVLGLGLALVPGHGRVGVLDDPPAEGAR